MITQYQAEVQILVNGKPIKQHWHNSQWWTEARRGVNYEIKLKNNTFKRLLAIVSVDGIDVLSGKPADKDSGGYLIPAYGSYSVKGFRTSNEEVNLFEFSDKEQSYAVESPTGEQSSANCGVIAVRFIEEKQKPINIMNTYRRGPEKLPFAPPIRDPWIEHPTRPEPYWSSPLMRSFADNSSNLSSKGISDGESIMFSSCMDDAVTDWMEQERSASFDMGTKFSDKTATDRVTTVEFEQGALLTEVSIYYASRKALEKMGVSFEPENKVVLPKAFKNTYCQPPKRR